RRKRRARIKEERVRRPVAGERRDRCLLLRALVDLLSIATVFGREHELVELVREIAVRPAEVVAFVRLEQLFRRIVGVVMGVEFPTATVAAELIAAVHRGPQLIIERADRDAHRVANTLREMNAGRLGLTFLASVEPPDAGASVELRAGILAGRILG